MVKDVEFDLMAFMELLRRKCGEDTKLTPGCEYSFETPVEEVIEILGEAPDVPTAYNLSFKETADGDYEIITHSQKIN